MANIDFFAFAKSNLTDNQLAKTELLVTGIKFHGANQSQIKKWSARTFVEINSKQRPVPNELIYLLTYRVMKENQPKDLATEAIKTMNTSKSNSLYSLFKTNPFTEKSEKGTPKIRIVTIANTLKPLFSKQNQNISRGVAGKLLIKQVKEMEKYFSDIKHIFKQDWEDGPKNSLIFTTNYMSGLCDILVRSKKQKESREKTKKRLLRLKTNINSSLKKHNSRSRSFNDMKGPNGEILWRENQYLPRPSNQSAIKKFLLKKAGFRKVN